jgi:hypothetical protein
MKTLETSVRATRPGAPKKQHRRGLRKGVAAALGLLAVASVVPGLPSAVAEPGNDPLATSPELDVLGESQLGKSGLNGNVTVVGDTAVVASGVLPAAGTISGYYAFPYPCRESRVKVVDIGDPASPTVVGRIVVPNRTVAADVDAISVTTPSFTGDLLAVALFNCNSSTNPAPAVPTDRGVAYYDITNPATPQFLGRYRANVDATEAAFQCGPNPRPAQPGDKPVANRPNRPQADSRTTSCATSVISVELAQRPDGQVVSLSTQPFSTAGNNPDGGDLRIVDVTNPTNPTQVSSFPAPPRSGFSSNGCKPFSAAREATLNADGTKAALAYLDDGLFDIDLTSPAAPTATNIDPYPATPPASRLVEGNGSYVSLTGADEGTALLSDEDWNGVTTFLRIDSTSTDQGLSTGLKFGCEATFTLFDPEDTAQIYRNPGFQVPAGEGNSAEIVYTGFGCPGGPTLLDANFNDINPAGKIVLTDRGGCGLADKAIRAQADGSIGVIIRANFSGSAFGPDGDPFVSGGTSVPVMSIDEPAGAQLRATLCPEAPAPPGNGPPVDRICSGTPVTGAMVDQPGTFGGVRALDLTADTQVGEYKTPRTTLFPPPDLGSYSAGRSESDEDTAYVAWHSDGVRILDTSDPANITEVGHFVPPDRPDPSGSGIPAKALVVGVDQGPDCTIVISDIHTGLYILDDPTCTPVP